MAKEKKVKEPKLVKPKKASKKNEIEDVKTPLEVGETFDPETGNTTVIFEADVSLPQSANEVSESNIETVLEVTIINEPNEESVILSEPFVPKPKRSLVEIFAEIGNHTGVDIGHNDKNSTHTYLEKYDELFAPFRNGCSFMEIGLAMGESIRLVDEYFENSKIVGVDLSIVFTPPAYENQVELIACDGTKPELLDKLGDQMFDIVIDDGSHMTQDQLDTFNLLKGRMKPGGVYIIEDILAWGIEESKYRLLHNNIEVVDMRHINGRFDNILLIFRF